MEESGNFLYRRYIYILLLERQNYAVNMRECDNISIMRVIHSVERVLRNALPYKSSFESIRNQKQPNHIYIFITVEEPLYVL